MLQSMMFSSATSRPGLLTPHTSSRLLQRDSLIPTTPHPCLRIFPRTATPLPSLFSSQRFVPSPKIITRCRYGSTMKTKFGKRTEMENQLIPVISQDFCVPQEVDLTIVRKVTFSSTDGNFEVTDDKGNVVFEVEEKFFSVRGRHVLLDAGGTPIVTFNKKIFSLHKRWQVFRGDSLEPADLLFTVKKSSIFQFRTELDVFLSGNDEESFSDFKVVVDWFEQSCIIYRNDSAPIAEMHKEYTFWSIVLGKDTFAVTVYPQVDYAFIVTLVVILREVSKVDKFD